VDQHFPHNFPFRSRNRFNGNPLSSMEMKHYQTLSFLVSAYQMTINETSQARGLFQKQINWKFVIT
jgi:hypothetical protein